MSPQTGDAEKANTDEVGIHIFFNYHLLGCTKVCMTELQGKQKMIVFYQTLC